MGIMDDMASGLRKKALVESLLAALKHADASINPPDRDGISLDKWNGRLKSATVEIRAAINRAELYLSSHGADHE